jgi:hypothetical protein
MIQLPPLDFTDVSLLFGISAIILLATAVIYSTYYGLTGFNIDKKRFEDAGVVAVIFFLVTVAIRIISIMTGA